MKKLKVIRHGEITIIETDTIPKEAKLSKSNSLAIGVNGNSHTFKGGKFYELKKGMYVFGYLKASKLKLYHTEHSPEGASIPDGSYELRKAVEFINNEMKVVID